MTDEKLIRKTNNHWITVTISMTGKARTFWDLAAATWRACGKEPHIGLKEMPVELRKTYQYFTEAPIGKLRAVGYTTPMTTLEEGIRKYVQDFLVQPDPYR